MSKEIKKKSTIIYQLPYCPNRMGKIEEKRFVIACGARLVEAEECVKCETALKLLNP